MGGTVEGEGGLFPLGTHIYLAARPDVFYEFVRWEGHVPDAMLAEPEIELLMDLDRTVSAVFGLVVPEWWRVRHFSTVDVDLEADADDDGLSNRLEFGLGTDPRSSAVTEQPLELSFGWNLISLPVFPSVEGGRLAGLGPAVHPVAWEWDPLAQSYVATQSARTLAGVWVFASKDCTISLKGQAVVDRVLRVYSGWNQSGVGIAATMTDSTLFDGRVWRWSSHHQAYRSITPGEDIPRGTGMWIHAGTESLLDLPAP